MPSKSEKQHKAMEVAASGRGRLGIPVAVAQEYVMADAGKRRHGSKKHAMGKRK